MSMTDKTHVLQSRSPATSYQFRLLAEQFFEENPIFHQILLESSNIEELRERVYHYLNDFERKLYTRVPHHGRERVLARQALSVLKNCFSRRSEAISHSSSLQLFHSLAHGRDCDATSSFISDFRHLFLAMKMKTGIFSPTAPFHNYATDSNIVEAHRREQYLRRTAETVSRGVTAYLSGYHPTLLAIRSFNQQRIMKAVGVSEETWQDWRWQYQHAVRSVDQLKTLIPLNEREEYALRQAEASGIPMAVTPYYLSLMDDKGTERWDKTIRAQVFPPLSYVSGVLEAGEKDISLDFMGESQTSPVDHVTRRYPLIAILKPFNTCAQICVYCQRNWEITSTGAPDAVRPREAIEKALQWFSDHPEVEEVLITGGDPALLPNRALNYLMDRVSQLPHVRRIRIGTRTPVVLPMRITEEFAEILASYQVVGRREICVMTHFEHAAEVTPEAAAAVSRLRKRSISVYNQAVFTLFNSRRFEMVALRQALRSIGVDPYYTFNLKGKQETSSYQVPIARLIQEQAEEARLCPGLERTDEAVFNIPRLGKTYLKAGQDHDVIQILSDGRRLYEFYPWAATGESLSYFHYDTPIHSYLRRLKEIGESPDNYETIWYYY